MKKWIRGLMGLAAAGGVIAGLIYYFKKQDTCEDEEFDDDFEDDDFDLDSDLKPVSDREYVSLNPSAKSEEEAEKEADSAETEEAGKASEEDAGEASKEEDSKKEDSKED